MTFDNLREFIAAGGRYELYTDGEEVIWVLPLADDQIIITPESYEALLNQYGYKIVPM
ncbi:hypothetical protein [Chimaeribacter coloradensis]|uniref:hypothetical protein n=1 Tax=Chimaeribacter coloradensis TaxID=2060068 RepID=UPI0013FD0997|nr:hypothetical protein [Chimaeribacter coloradensis]